MQLFSFFGNIEQNAESWSVFEAVLMLLALIVDLPFNQVRFSRPESEQARQRRIQSYEFLQKKQAEEPWVHLHYHGIKVRVIMWLDWRILTHWSHCKPHQTNAWHLHRFSSSEITFLTLTKTLTLLLKS